MNIEQLRNKFIDILQKRTGVGFDEKVTADKLLDISIGGEVKSYMHTDKGTRMERRPRLLKDCVEEER